MEIPRIVTIIVISAVALCFAAMAGFLVSAEIRESANGLGVLLAAVGTILTTLASAVLGLSGLGRANNKEREK